MSEETTSASIAKKLGAKVENWLTLDVITRVGEVDPTLDATTLPTGGQCMRTRIRLLEGDIVHEQDPSYAAEDRAKLVEEHFARVDKAEAIVERTVKTVLELAKWIDERAKADPQADDAGGS